MRRISRREFIQTTALGLGALSVLDRLPGAAMAFDPADVLLHNGNIITVDARDTVVQAVALKKGIIVKIICSNDDYIYCLFFYHTLVIY